jgi:chromosome partitioning protein
MIVSFANPKGGTGKTTTVVNLGAAVALDGLRVLVIDLVPQGDATFLLGESSLKARYTLSDTLVRGVSVRKAIQKTALPGLFLLPSSPDLINIDLELAPLKGRECILKESISSGLAEDFDFIFLDCPSAVNLLLVNAFTSSHSLLVPTTPSFLSVRGLKEVLRVQAEMKRNLDCGLDFLGILLTMVDYRLDPIEEIVGKLRSSFGKKVLNTTIERMDSLMAGPAAQRPLLQMRQGGRVVRAYVRLKDEFIQRAGGYRRMGRRGGKHIDDAAQSTGKADTSRL